ncbi:hypothetical protein [Flavobacterium sp.]|uniref:hypothetical protein n=1 Tax=Flavobacterium sp. TaxID=239 RepID=UPI00326410EB
MKKTSKSEAEILSNYLLKNCFDATIPERYKLSLEKLAIEKISNPKELFICNKAIQSAFLLPYLDAGFAWLNSDHLIRKKMIVMLSIIETTPQYTSKFMSENDIKFPFIKLVGLGIKSVFYASIGVLIIVLFRWK